MVCCWQFADGVEALFDFRALHGGPQQALAEQAAAHAGQGLIEHAEHGGLRVHAAGIGGEERLDQFEVAHGDGVEHHGIGAIVVGGAVEMIERGALRVAQVVEDGSGGADGGGTVGEAAAIEREQLEMIAQGAVGVVEREDPVFEFGAHEAQAGAIFAGEERQVAGEEDFARAEVFEGTGDFLGFHFGDAEFAGGDIDVGDGGARAGAADGGEEVVLARAHEVGIHGGAGRDDARDFAAHQFLGELGVLHLIADGDAVALLDEARDVAFGGVEGDAAHGDGVALFLIARGEGDFEFARGGHGVFEEELVKIAEAKHEQGIGHLLLDAVVLPHQRRGGVGHSLRTVSHGRTGRPVRLGVDAAQLDGLRDAIERHHVGGGAIVDAVLFGIGDDGVEAFIHDLLQALIDQVLVPEEALAVLHPFEVGDGDAAGVGQNVGNHEDLLARRGFQSASGVVGPLAPSQRILQRTRCGVLRGDDVLRGGGNQDVAIEEHGLGLIHIFAAGEAGDGAGFLAMLLQRGDIEAVGIVDRAIVFDDAR